MKALVTGGAGFIGSHIVDRLLSDGHSVVVIDDFSTGHRENLPDHHSQLKVVECDIRDFAKLNENMKGVDWVFHKAAIASVPKTVEDPVGSQAVNYQGTLHVLESARKNQVKRVVFASSAALYGDEPTLPKVETMLPVVLSPYAVDKLASEYACGMYSKLYGVETVCLRYFNVFGPKQDPSSPYSGVISVFKDKLAQNITPVIYGDGEQTRDFVYVSDVVEANMKAITADGVSAQVFNVATSTQVSLNELLHMLCEINSTTFKVDYKDERKGDIKYSFANIDKIKKFLNWKVTIDLKEGLATF